MSSEAASKVQALPWRPGFTCRGSTACAHHHMRSWLRLPAARRSGRLAAAQQAGRDRRPGAMHGINKSGITAQRMPSMCGPPCLPAHCRGSGVRRTDRGAPRGGTACAPPRLHGRVGEQAWQHGAAIGKGSPATPPFTTQMGGARFTMHCSWMAQARGGDRRLTGTAPTRVRQPLDCAQRQVALRGCGGQQLARTAGGQACEPRAARRQDGAAERGGRTRAAAVAVQWLQG